MAKKTKRWIELPTPYEPQGELADYKPGTIRVRKEMWRGGSRYVMNDWLTVPPVLRRLDGRTWRGLLLALLLLVAGAVAFVRLLGGAK